MWQRFGFRGQAGGAAITRLNRDAINHLTHCYPPIVAYDEKVLSPR
jgi:hypothetical protein